MMINIIEYSSPLKPEWDAFISKSKNGIFLFYRDYMEYHSDRFKDSSILFYQNNELIAVLPLNREGSVLFSHQGLTFGGLIYNNKIKQQTVLDCFESLITYMKKIGCVRLVYKKLPSIYTSVPSDEDIYALFKHNAKILKVEPASTINLENPVTLSKGRKAQISRARREGVTIADSTDFETFINLENYVLKQRHNAVAVHTAKEIHLLHSRFPNNIQLSFAYRDKTPIATCLLFIHDRLVHTQYLAANEEARKVGALDLLLFEKINYYKNNKNYFDFGISTENNGQELNTGLISQKESFGGRSIPHITFELLIH